MAGSWCVVVIPGSIQKPKNHWRDILADNMRLNETIPDETGGPSIATSTSDIFAARQSLQKS
jgi:hypothetical protein